MSTAVILLAHLRMLMKTRESPADSLILSIVPFLPLLSGRLVPLSAAHPNFSLSTRDMWNPVQIDHISLQTDVLINPPASAVLIWSPG
jgi:hypothetical protein